MGHSTDRDGPAGTFLGLRAPSHQNLTNRREVVQMASPAQSGSDPHSPRSVAKS